jgi:hypothetical protein
MDRVRNLRPNIVVLSAYWDYSDPDHDRVTRAAKLLHTIELVKAAGVQRVVVLGSAPFWITPVPTLLLSELHRNPDKPVPHRLPRGLLTAHDDTLLEMTALKAGAFYVPVFESLCDQTSCIATTGSGWKDFIMYDQSHFTDHGAVLLVHRIWPMIVNSRS